MLEGNKVMITVALNGGMQQDRDGAVVPKQPVEIGEAAARCWEAGASVVHVHARDPDGKNSGDPAIYAEIIRQIRVAQPDPDPDHERDRRAPRSRDRAVHLADRQRTSRPARHRAAAGPVRHRRRIGGLPQSGRRLSRGNALRELAATAEAHDRGGLCQGIGARVRDRRSEFAAPPACAMPTEGLFDRHRANLWLLHGGGFGATPPVARNVIFNIDEGLRMFPQAIWGVTATGRDMFRIATLGLAMGCDLVRVGFEDGVHLPDGSVARDNAEMVRAAAADRGDLWPAAGERGRGARAVRHMTSAVASPREIRATIAICTAIYVLDGLIHTILGPLAPDIARTLTLGKAELGPIFSSNLIGQCIGLVVFPAIANRFGHRPTVTLAVLGFGLGQCASALADSGTSLFAIRLVTGIFLGGCLPSCLAIVTELAPPARRGVSILVLFTGYGFGAAVAGIVAAGFADYRRLARGDGRRRRGVASRRGGRLAVAARAALSRTGNGASRTSRTSPPCLQILGPAYLVGTLMLWLLFVVMLTISYCLNSWLPIMLVEAGFDESFAALSVTIFGFGGAIAALGVGLLIDRFGAMPVLIGFLVAAAAALLATGPGHGDGFGHAP